MDTVQYSSLLLCVFLVAIARSDADALHHIMTLRSTALVSPHCHDHTTMICNIDSHQEPTVIYFAWINPEGTVLCELDTHGRVINHNSRVNCTYRDKQLVLTIHDVIPLNEGKYHCKLRSSLGVKSAVTDLKLKECHHRLHHHTQGSNVTCWARGVYPEAHIHWFQGPQNLTHLSVAHPSSQADDGTYEVVSTLLHHPTSAFKCSLWSPTSVRYLTSTEMHPGATHAETWASSKANFLGAVGTIATLLAAALTLL
ncbi:hypothetical protein ACEWY4_018264 [Coilia grayii]|uniref:Ig-like domain-containing protein n=1 Tax=Coilia grayii TaxID=363190 RepID=A0ABD1JKK7_9TELE